MRRRLNTEEVEEPPADENSQSDSQTSSVEGLYGAISGRTSHPFKVVDHDALSLQSGVSIGRLGRIPAGATSSNSSNHSSTTSTTTPQLLPQDNVSPSGMHLTNTLTAGVSQQQPPSSSAQTMHPPSEIMTDAVPSSSNSLVSTGDDANSDFRVGNSFVPEPDVVISCKDKAGSGDFSETAPMKAPVAPPRRKRKGFGTSSARSKLDELGSMEDVRSRENTPELAVLSRQASRIREAKDEVSSLKSFSPQTPPSPTVSIRSACRDMDKQLEIASQKFWIVKAQDEEKTRAKSSGPKALRRTESLPKDVIAAFEPSGTGSGGQREKDSSHSNSNSSTLNSTSLPPAPEKNGSVNLPSPVPTVSSSTSGSNGREPGNLQLSSIISAMAALEEKKEAECQLNMNLRTRTDSGKFLSDMEILEQVQVGIR